MGHDLHLESTVPARLTNGLRRRAALTVCDMVPTRVPEGISERDFAAEMLVAVGLIRATEIGTFTEYGGEGGVTWSRDDEREARPVVAGLRK